jgi:hypothetical protein
MITLNRRTLTRETQATLRTEGPGISRVVAVTLGASAVGVSRATAKERPNGKIASDELHGGPY